MPEITYQERMNAERTEKVRHMLRELPLSLIHIFGAPALALMLVSVVFAVLSELVYEKITHQKTTIDDLSAVVTGLLLAFNLPANAPWWMAAIGSIIAIVLVKQMFGGIGQNFINPALAARTIPVSYTHLDVYKRQPISCGWIRRWCGRGWPPAVKRPRRLSWRGRSTAGRSRFSSPLKRWRRAKH